MMYCRRKKFIYEPKQLLVKQYFLLMINKKQPTILQSHHAIFIIIYPCAGVRSGKTQMWKNTMGIYSSSTVSIIAI